MDASKNTQPTPAPVLAPAAAFSAVAAAAATATSPQAFLADAMAPLAGMVGAQSCTMLPATAAIDDGPAPDGSWQWKLPLELADGRTLGTVLAYGCPTEAPGPELLELVGAYGAVLALGFDRITERIGLVRSDAVIPAPANLAPPQDPWLNAPRDPQLDGELAELATELGAEDLFVFRRVSGRLYSHLGGAGRGAGWAGNIELESGEEQHLSSALAQRQPICVDFDRAARIVGPYYGRSAVIVPSGPDSVVVFGSSTDSVAGADTERAIELAVRAHALIRDVSPAKRLADELEVLAAVREVTTVQGESVTETLSTIAARARAAMSAEFTAIATIPSGDVDGAIGASAAEWAPLDPDAPARALARFSAHPERLPLLSQDVGELVDAPEGFRRGDGVSSIYVLPIGEPVIAIMLIAHAEPGLRGFTSLCQRVAGGMSDAAEPVVRRAIAQERLREENARLALKLRTDALTGVASRSAWEEVLRAVELEHARTRTPFSVVVIDLDGLKAVNDAAGHAAGDELLRRAARLLASSVRSGDLVARIGGDEFGVLLRSADSNQVVSWCERLDERIRGSGQTPLTWSLGAASVPPQATIADAVAEADRRMYERKVERRVGRP